MDTQTTRKLSLPINIPTGKQPNIKELAIFKIIKKALSIEEISFSPEETQLRIGVKESIDKHLATESLEEIDEITFHYLYQKNTDSIVHLKNDGSHYTHIFLNNDEKNYIVVEGSIQTLYESLENRFEDSLSEELSTDSSSPSDSPLSGSIDSTPPTTLNKQNKGTQAKEATNPFLLDELIAKLKASNQEDSNRMRARSLSSTPHHLTPTCPGTPFAHD